jgi:hypothetical protein
MVKSSSYEAPHSYTFVYCTHSFFDLFNVISSTAYILSVVIEGNEIWYGRKWSWPTCFQGGAVATNLRLNLYLSGSPLSILHKRFFFLNNYKFVTNIWYISFFKFRFRNKGKGIWLASMPAPIGVAYFKVQTSLSADMTETKTSYSYIRHLGQDSKPGLFE